MKLEEVLNYVNSFEKNSFLKIIDNIISEKPKNYKAIDKILNELDGQLKNADNQSIARVLSLVEDEFVEVIKKEFLNTVTQLDILIDIIIRDGNSLMKREWLAKLYEKQIKKIKIKLKEFRTLVESEDDDARVRDYKIYRNCLKTAYHNDKENNQENKITQDEQSILVTLGKGLDLSQEELKMINYLIIPLKKLEIDEIIKYLTSIGVIFYSRKNYQVYVADEIVRILRKIRGKEISDKVFRRVLKQLKDSNINLLARKHNIDRSLSREEKIKEIINEGISFSGAFMSGIFKDGTTKTEKKKYINELIDKKLKIDEKIGGSSLEAKVENFVKYFEDKEREGGISVSVSGYEKLIIDLEFCLPKINKSMKEEFELQEENVLNARLLLNYNIKPIDVLYLIDDDSIKKFCDQYGISTRGNEVNNILDAYKDVENLLIENYVNVARRDFNGLKENGIEIKESEIGLKFEEITKSIFKKLGFNIDETLKKSLSNSKNQMDILIKFSENEVIIIECKSIKERGYNKYSMVSRQVKSYKELVESNGFIVKKTFVIAPEFTDDFINECGLDYDLNLSLITAETLSTIYRTFTESDLKKFPVTLLLRDVLINKERVLKAMTR